MGLLVKFRDRGYGSVRLWNNGPERRVSFPDETLAPDGRPRVRYGPDIAGHGWAGSAYRPGKRVVL
jgi:hypothetical protein